MSSVSSIEWTDRTWNPVRGCAVVSPGCVNCYAMKQAHRFSGMYKAAGLDGPYQVPGPYYGLTKATKAGPQWTGAVRTVPETVLEPCSWRTPQRVFVNSMSDLFHEAVPDDFVVEVFATMAVASRHTFQILTKRPERMLEFLTSRGRSADVAVAVFKRFSSLREADRRSRSALEVWPLPNVWLGVSAEDQRRADERIPLLLETPAAVRFLSAEPLLGPLDLMPFLDAGRETGGPAGWQSETSLDWVIVGGESGSGARPVNVAWIRSVVRQCRASQVPVFVKQLGTRVIDRNDAGFDGTFEDSWPVAIVEEDRIEHDLDGTRDGYQGAPVRIHLRDRKGGNPAEWPEDLRVRAFPCRGGVS